MNDCSRPKVLLFSSEETWLQAIRPTIAPSGNGSFPSRYALIAMSFPRTARMSLRSPASWATETTFQSRYPGGTFLTKSGAAGASARRAADAVNAITLTSTVAAISQNAIRFMASSSSAMKPDAELSIHHTKVSTILSYQSHRHQRSNPVQEFDHDAVHLGCPLLLRPVPAAGQHDRSLKTEGGDGNNRAGGCGSAAIHGFSADDGAVDLDVHDLIRLDVVRILLEHHEVGKLAGGDRP